MKLKANRRYELMNTHIVWTQIWKSTVRLNFHLIEEKGELFKAYKYSREIIIY